MSDPQSSIQLDINDLLESFAAENARAVKRAVIAEAGIKVRDQSIANLEEAVNQLGAEVRRLRDAFEPDEHSPQIDAALVDGLDEAEQPTPIRRTRKPPAKKTT